MRKNNLWESLDLGPIPVLPPCHPPTSVASVFCFSMFLPHLTRQHEGSEFSDQKSDPMPTSGSKGSQPLDHQGSPW